MSQSQRLTISFMDLDYYIEKESHKEISWKTQKNIGLLPINKNTKNLKDILKFSLDVLAQSVGETISQQICL